jgi:Iron-dependent Transcriptional regulator
MRIPVGLPRVMAHLARAGLVTSRIGRSGGYRLARPPSRISLLEVIDGQYPVVTHAFNFVRRGALGIIQAGDGDPTN